MTQSRRAVFLLVLIFATPCFATPGKVVGWGDNYAAQSGPWLDPPASGSIGISARGGVGLALQSNGTVIGWGDNTFGQDKIPLGLSGVTAVAAGKYHGVALKSDGTVVAWGSDGHGQATPPGSLTNVTSIASGGEHSIALLPNNTVLGWGDNGYGQANPPPPLNSNIVEVAAGDHFSVARRTDGSIFAWGDNTSGQITPSPAITGVVAIAAGEKHGLAIMGGGIVMGWGDNTANQTTIPFGLSNVVAIAAGEKHSIALKSDTTVSCWGDNSYGQCSIPGGLSNVIAIAAGDHVSFALRSDGTIVRWGWVPVKIPAAGIPDAIAVAGGGAHSLALLSNSTVVGWGDDYKGQATPPGGLTNVTAIAAGFEHSVALRANGFVVAWGNNNQGQTSVPAGATGILKIAAGYYFSLALKGNGTVTNWGDPVGIPPPGLTNVVDIAAGGYHGLARLSDGSVVAWGLNTSGQASPPGLTNVVEIAAGEYFSIARLSNGTVIEWGTTNFALNNPPLLTNAIAIAAGRQHGVALKSDGSFATWGDNFYKQIPAPSGLAPALGVGAGAYHTLGIFTVPPVIATMPTNLTVFAGSNAAFSVTAGSGTPPLFYQWRFNTGLIAGATSSVYTLSNAAATNAGSFDVFVGNVAGTVTSTPAVLTVLVPPLISAGPSSLSVLVSNPANFSVTASGSAPLFYQWRFNGTNIPGANATNYAIGSALPSAAGSYAVVVTNAAGAVTGGPAVLTVLVPPGIAVPPQNASAVAGTSTGFAVSATGTAPLFYQWRKGGTNIAGATGTNYMIAGVQPTDVDVYDVVVTNIAGAITSASATLSVLVPPSITNQPQGQSLATGTSTSLTVGATGSPTLYYQWRKNGTRIAGATGSTLPLPSVVFADSGNYDAIVSNTVGSVTSATAVVVVQSPPTISIPPLTHPAWLDVDATFRVFAAGTAPLYYQWQFNAADLPGATNAVLPINDVQVGDAGPYNVIVSNAFGAVTSSVATLIVRSQTAGGSRNDFDGDGKSDLAVKRSVPGRWTFTVWRGGTWHNVTLRRPVAMRWEILESTMGRVTFDFGVTNDVTVPCDYDGDGWTDIGVYRKQSSAWYIVESGRSLLTSTNWGSAGMVPAPGDYDGDGKSDLALYNPATGDWRIRNSSNGLVTAGNWGWTGAVPIPGDYDGDGRTDIAVYQRSAGNWFIRKSSNNVVLAQNFGSSGTVPVPGDYDNDGKTDLAVFNQSTGDWYLQLSGIGQLRVIRFGWSGTVPVQGDYDGDTMADVAVYDQAGSRWYIRLSATGQLMTGGPISFGATNAPPITP